MTSQIKTRKKLKDKNRWIHDLTAGRDIGKYNLNKLTRHHNKVSPEKVSDDKPSEPSDNFWDDYVKDLIEQMNKDGKVLPGELKAPTKQKFDWKGAYNLANKYGVKEYGRIKKRYENQATQTAKDQLSRGLEIVKKYNKQTQSDEKKPNHYPSIKYNDNYDEGKHDNTFDIEYGKVKHDKYNLMPVNSKIRDDTSIDHLERINKPSVEESIKYETAYRPKMPRRPAPKIEIPKIDSPFWLGLNDPSDARLLGPERQVMVDDPLDNNNEVSSFINRFTERMNQPVEDLGNLSDDFDSMYP